MLEGYILLFSKIVMLLSNHSHKYKKTVHQGDAEIL